MPKSLADYNVQSLRVAVRKHNKKVRDGKMRFILPKEIGAVDIYDNVEDSLFLKFFS